MVKIMLVEDEMIIAEDMRWMLEEMGYEVIGNAIDYARAIEILDQKEPDLILLDINLGGQKDGIDLAKTINEKYGVPFIFTTSHTDPGTLERAKEVRPVNYLVKPFKREQLFTAIEVALFNLASANHDENKAEEMGEGLVIKDAIFIKDKYKYTKLNISDILWMKADKNYLEIHTSGKREIIRATLSGFLEKLNRHNLMRVHKSYAINVDHLSSLEPTRVMIGEATIPITKNYGDELIRKLDIL
jgi:DNA-binding LytR/AlgR family response regulator